MPEKEFHELRQQLNAHMDDFNTFKAQQEMRNKHEDERWEALLKVTERNTQSIESIANSTHEVVEAYTVTTNTVKGLGVVGQFVKWLAGFAVVGAAINWIINLSSKA